MTSAGQLSGDLGWMRCGDALTGCWDAVRLTCAGEAVV